MLVMSRKQSESLYIDGGRIVVTVLSIRGNKVRLGVEAPQETTVHRKEIHDLIVGGQEIRDIIERSKNDA